MRAAAWPPVAEIPGRRANRAVRSFAELHGTGRASDNPRIIQAAAAEGRVGTLLMAARPRCPEQFPTGIPVVQLGAEGAFSHCELLDRVAARTLARGGNVHVLAAPEIPGGSDIAAVLRY